MMEGFAISIPLAAAMILAAWMLRAPRTRLSDTQDAAPPEPEKRDKWRLVEV
jgi:hypothetical protein